MPQKSGFSSIFSDYTMLLPILKAAKPHLLSPICSYVNIIIKILEVLDALKEKKPSQQYKHTDSSFAGITDDPEALILAIKEYCPISFRGQLDSILGIFRAIKFYDTYKDVFSMMSAMQAADNPYTEATPCDAPQSCYPDNCDAPCNMCHDCDEQSDPVDSCHDAPQGIHSSIPDSLTSLLSDKDREMFEVISQLIQSNT